MSESNITYDYEAARGFLTTLQQAGEHLEHAQLQTAGLYHMVQTDEEAGSTQDVYAYKGSAGPDMCKFLEGLYGHLNTAGELINIQQEYLSVYNTTVLNMESDLTTQLSLAAKESRGV